MFFNEDSNNLKFDETKIYYATDINKLYVGITLQNNECYLDLKNRKEGYKDFTFFNSIINSLYLTAPKQFAFVINFPSDVYEVCPQINSKIVQVDDSEYTTNSIIRIRYLGKIYIYDIDFKNYRKLKNKYLSILFPYFIYRWTSKTEFNKF